jgi:enoyl-CoA hydratase/carnithine racemase
MGEFVRIDIDAGVATIRIDRPPANALARAVSSELSQAAASVTGDEAVRAVVIWGGERIFAAGADIKAMVDYGPDEIADDVGALEQACRDLEAIPKVTIAAIEGFALGGGLEVALACDLRVAAQNAKLGLPEIRLGVIPGSGGTQRLPRLIGLARARQMVFSGDPVSADRALESGLIDAVSPAGEAYANASQWAQSHAVGPSLAFAAAKRALAAADRPLEEGLRVEREAFVALFATRDQEEGMRAFLDKREPRFEGR